MQPVARPYLDKGRIEVIEPPTLADAQSTYAVPSYVAEGGLKTFADIARFRTSLAAASTPSSRAAARTASPGR